MSKKMTSKSQAKHLKNRNKRKAVNYVSKTSTRPYDRKYVQSLLMRSAQVNGRTASAQDIRSLVGETIQVSAATGCTIEVFERLVSEQKIVPTEQQLADIKAFDELSVKFNETADFVMIVLQDGDVKGIPPELLMDLGFKSQDLHLTAKAMLDSLIVHATLIDAYMVEHAQPDASYQQTVYGYAMERMGRVSATYATPAILEAEEVNEEALEEAGFYPDFDGVSDSSVVAEATVIETNTTAV